MNIQDQIRELAKQKNAIISADNPWGPNFDATIIYGPVHGAVFYIGVRVNWNKI